MTLIERLKADLTTITAWSSVPDALTVEILAGQGFDAITLDMQHGGHNEDSVLRCLLPIAAAGKPSLVRIPVGRFDMASRALDFGADAVIAPMINTIEDARRFAAAMKYPPVGERSWGPTYAAPRRNSEGPAAWLRDSNASTISFAMIETRAALALVDDILEIPGIDGIFVGPSDFSIAWTDGAEINPSLEDMMEAIASIATKTRAAGKYAAIYVVDPALTGRMVAMGYRLLATGSEQQVMALGAKSLLDAMHSSIG
ncbi:HpcH/HpaI aldolase/citrate lyase family protein [Corticibacterium sp. UT-5YL-CI-8]|nr:HpcH/HpaI aldolase/citrate lyase family protein [Tianweitania sp. UT-5YL-CI-8]